MAKSLNIGADAILKSVLFLKIKNNLKSILYRLMVLNNNNVAYNVVNLEVAILKVLTGYCG